MASERELKLGTNGKLVDPTPTDTSSYKTPGHPNEGQTLVPARAEVPKNLEGKKPDEIVQDYSKLQSELGRRANEIGELRKRLEAFEQSQRETNPPEDGADDSSDLAPIRAELNQLKADKLRAELKATHPDYSDIVQRPEFGEWVKEKQSRLLLAMSGEAGNVDAARELLDMYSAAREEGNATPKEAVRRDRVARAGASERGGSQQTPIGKIYSRSELQNMRAFDKRRYDEMLPEITRAYREGRVR